MDDRFQSIDCDFTTGKCPTCGKEKPPGHRRNCPAKAHLKKRPRPGTEFYKLARQLGVQPKPGCTCGAVAARMNVLGVAGCQAHRGELLAALAENYQLYGLKDKLTAAVHAVASGLAFRLDPRDPLGSLFDEALRRAAFHVQ